MDKHALVCAVKTLADELGHVPTYAEFKKANNGRGQKCIEREFGGYMGLCAAAGLENEGRKRAQRIDNSVFQVDINEHIDNYKPKEIVESKPWPTIAAISDIHRPFQNERIIKLFYEYVGDEKPKYVMELGDGRDFIAHSKYATSLNIFSPREENELARKHHVEFWKRLREISPNSELICLLGNHCQRPLKKTLEVYPAAEHWIEEAIKQEFTFDVVKTIFDPREEYIIDNRILAHHGFKTGLGSHRDFYRMSCIVGHSHKGGVVWRTMANGELIFELNCGTAADLFSKGLSYTPNKLTEQTPGFGGVNKYGPQFIGG